VAALLLVRAVGANLDGLLLGARNSDLGTWFGHVFNGYGALLTMAAPMLVIIIATANLGPQRGAGRSVALAAAVVFSAGIGTLMRVIDWGGGWDVNLDMLLYVWPRYALFGGMLTVVGELYRSEVVSNEAAQRAEIDRITYEREMTEARLQVLQAQIEPHFLFNTLANTRRLYAEDPVVGREMLESLMRYLEVALPQMQNDEWTLERDSELIEAYLHIQRIRMGPRLAFSVDIPPELRAHHVPPMMLLTLVENAIKHGLNPSPNGGLIRVMARSDGNQVVVTVADTGIGFTSASGSGIGLANISARLAAQFGDQAYLTLGNNEFGGATATIVLPRAEAVRV
jgi:signal transduction histidine kinase